MFPFRQYRDPSAAGRSRPALTPRWLRDAVFAHRMAFEREMQRDRARLEKRFQAYMNRDRTGDEVPSTPATTERP